MKTTPEHRPNEATKQLFRELFQAQCEFERCADSSDPQVAMILFVIDQLFEMMLQDWDE